MSAEPVVLLVVQQLAENIASANEDFENDNSCGWGLKLEGEQPIKWDTLGRSNRSQIIAEGRQRVPSAPSAAPSISYLSPLEVHHPTSVL